MLIILIDIFLTSHSYHSTLSCVLLFAVTILITYYACKLIAVADVSYNGGFSDIFNTSYLFKIFQNMQLLLELILPKFRQNTKLMI